MLTDLADGSFVDYILNRPFSSADHTQECKNTKDSFDIPTKEGARKAGIATILAKDSQPEDSMAQSPAKQRHLQSIIKK